MTKTLSINIITPDGELFKSDAVQHVIAKSVLGEVTLLPQHAPIFTRLEHGELHIKVDNKSRSFTIFQGFLNMTPDDSITILADNAQRTDELNIEAIKRAKQNAQKALENKEKLSATEVLRAETAMRRAIMELQIANKKRHLN